MTTLPLARTLRQRLATAAAATTATATVQARSWGWPGAIGLIGTVAALALSGVVLPVLQADAASLDRAIDATETRAARLEAQRRATEHSAPMVAVVAPLPAPQHFHDGFPTARERTQRLAAILTLASEHGLDVRRTEMRLQPQADLGLLRYSVAMPLSGAYPQWRAFVEAALANDPALSLDRVQLQRASASTAAVEIELSWTLWMQAEARTP